MQGPRHSNLARITIRLGILVLAVVALGACREERGSERTTADFQRLLDANGKRVLVVTPDGDPVAKLRKRPTKYKVYDESLAPVGYVSWQTDEAGAPQVSVRTLSGEALPIERVSEGTFELGDELRLERTDRGWAVFGPEAKLVGVFQKRGDVWQLRPGYDDAPTFTVTAEDTSWAVLKDDEPVLEARSKALSRLEALALKLDGLPMLHRVAAGAWMQRARPDRLPEKDK